MIPAFLAAPLAKPLVKWGIVGGVLVAAILSIWLHGFYTCKRSMQREYAEAVAQQAATAAQHAVDASVMEAKIVQDIGVAERNIQRKAKIIRKKVSTYGHAKQTVTISAPLVGLHDELRGLSGQARSRVSASNPGTGASEVSSGGVGPAGPQGLSIDSPDGGEAVTLTGDELAQAVMDVYEKYALMRNNYRGLSEWNDGRERLEKSRFGLEEAP